MTHCIEGQSPRGWGALRLQCITIVRVVEPGPRGGGRPQPDHSMSRLGHAVFGVTALVWHLDDLESLTGQISDYLVGVLRQHFKISSYGIRDGSCASLSPEHRLSALSTCWQLGDRKVQGLSEHHEIRGAQRVQKVSVYTAEGSHTRPLSGRPPPPP